MKEWVTVQVSKEVHDKLKQRHKVTEVSIRRLVTQAVKDSIWYKHCEEKIIKEEDES